MAEHVRHNQRSAEATAQRHLKLLERRVEYLQKRVDRAKKDGKVLSYDRSEILALQWAIGQLGRMWNYATPSRV